MSKQVQLRRGTTVQHTTFTGLEAELTVNTETKKLILHDGITTGGITLASESFVNASGITLASDITSAYEAYVNSQRAVPLSTLGKIGDTIGLVAVDSTFLYYCIAEYDGTTNIWMRQPLTGSSW